MTMADDFNPYQAPSQPVGPSTDPTPRPWVRAPLWRRVVAGVVDLAIALGCCMVGAAVVFGSFFILDKLNPFDSLDPIRDFLLFVLIAAVLLGVYGPFFAYYILMERSGLQGTFGKYLLDLVVIRTDGSRLTLWRSVFRTMTKTVGILLYGIGLIWMFFNRDRQALHDRVADTVVVLRDEREIIRANMPV